jgi:hypothetical protein
VLLAVKMVVVSVFAVVRFLAHGAWFLERRSCGGCGGRCLGGQHLLRKDLRRQRRERGHSTLEIVSAERKERGVSLISRHETISWVTHCQSDCI